MRKKIAMIGLDAADFDYIRSSISSLPNLRRTFESRRVFRLESTAELMTGSIWPTFCTGRLPGHHGIYHHLQWDPNGMRLRRVAPDWLYYEPFWYELERRGLRVIAVDVPMTHPPGLSRGVEVVSWGSHDTLTPFTAFPSSLQANIKRRFGKHPMGCEITVKKTRRELESIRSRLVEGAAKKAELCKWVLSTHEWDFFIGVFGECHRGGHILWPEDSKGDSPTPEGALLDVYRAVDRAVGELIQSLSDNQATIIVFSLHGMGPNISQEHFVPKIMDRVNRLFNSRGSTLPDGTGSRGQRSIMRMLRERFPAGIQNAIGRAVPVSFRDAVVNRSVTSGYDWERTPGFAQLADLNGYLRLNVRGRERDGMLEPGSKDMKDYVDWICECFRSLRIQESGEPLVKDICHASKEFSGDRSMYLPDLIVTWTGAAPATRVLSDKLGTLEAEIASGRSGNHRSDGFCIFLEGESSLDEEASPRHIKELPKIILRMFSESHEMSSF